ncbi:M20 family metallo-hydrolase [Jeotgalibacillus proteolyticus]|uniref:Zn-dependent hydrolase n=1 Tax=Jeotgalibacillus proteolyticus TaxID=2082395 RepID=A0A2S5GBE1_9BACL|nr:M20 family metallo-hydrolase [Jeotgalibacillus proteolyticus]PPA70309.1 Zn-dependent hydrolase [Jeotgalibacillus proteolyticus]
MKQWLSDTLAKLNLVDSMNQPEGFTRLSYSKEEWKAMAVFREIAEGLDLEVHQDQAGNMIAKWVPEGVSQDLPAVAAGSHLDTVTNGGGYDGAAGILCALAAVKHLKDNHFSPACPVEVICFASEESARFGVSTIGSKAMSGMLDLPSLESVTDQEGITVKEAAEERGLNWEQFRNAERSQEEIASFIELHIEQGLRVEQAKADYGAVTAIACPIRLLVTIEGKAGHTGTTPMGSRQDALVASVPLIDFISERAFELSAKSSLPIVATASTIEVKPNVMNVIPAKAELGIDIRSVDDQLKEQLEQEILEKCREIEETRNVTISSLKLVHNPSVFLDQMVHHALVDAGRTEGFTPFTLESGAGHDVMNMAKKWPSGLIFIPCENGLSHHPDEKASLEDLLKGVLIIAAYLRKETGE